MSQIKSKDSKIELLLRTELWHRGLRYCKNVNYIFGKPDIAFIGKRVAVFVDSEFWHGYDWENKKKDLKSNRDFWIQKIERNIERDNEVNTYLKKEGWVVLRFWGNDIKNDVSLCADIVEATLNRR